MGLLRANFILIFVFGILYGFQSFALGNGYISDVEAEQHEQYYEIFLFAEPAPKQETRLSDKIFNPELSQEFRRKYIEQFGNIDTDIFNYQDPRYAEISDNSGNLNAGINSDPASFAARQNFANYMIKRLTEWHVDHWFKEDPQLRPIYEAKEQLSKAEVRLNPETKMDAEYSLAGNTLDVKLINPYLDSKVTMYMDPTAFGPSTNIENRITLGKQLNYNTRVNFYATTNDGIATLEFIRKLRGNMTANVVGSTFFNETGTTSIRQTTASVGFSNSF